MWHILTSCPYLTVANPSSSLHWRIDMEIEFWLWACPVYGTRSCLRSSRNTHEIILVLYISLRLDRTLVRINIDFSISSIHVPVFKLLSELLYCSLSVYLHASIWMFNRCLHKQLIPEHVSVSTSYRLFGLYYAYIHAVARWHTYLTLS